MACRAVKSLGSGLTRAGGLEAPGNACVRVDGHVGVWELVSGGLRG
jgi:hypothetical protein